MKSTDNGKTWSTPEDITDQITKPDWHGDFKFIHREGYANQKCKLVHTLVNLQKGLHLLEATITAGAGTCWMCPLRPGTNPSH